MAVLSSGHLATDFASGSVPALLPFFTVEVRSQLHAHGRPDARRPRLVVADAAALRALVGPPRRALAAARGPRARGRGDRPRGGRAELRPPARPRVRRRASGSRRSIPRARSSPSFLSGSKRASGMSLFNIGGNLGYALGPIIVTPLVLWLGLGPGGLLASIPVVLASRRRARRAAVPRAPAAAPRGRERAARPARTTSGRWSSSRA